MSGLVRVAGKDIRFSSGDDETILDAAEAAGFALPYSCRKGVCETCKVHLVAGTVRQRTFGTRISGGSDVLSCAAVAEGAVEIEAPSIVRHVRPERVIHELAVFQIRPVSKEVVALRLRLPIGRRLRFAAGQYLRIMLPDGESRNYSIANPPHLNDEIELHVRQVPGGIFSDRVLQSLTTGSTLTVEAPYGLFSWTDDTDAPAIMLATGTGFAPIKSMIRQLIDKGLRKPVHLFWGGKTADDLYDHALAARWAAEFEWFDFTPVLVAPDIDLTSPIGFVQDAVASRYPDLTHHEVYACGNPLMIAGAQETLVHQCNLDAERFHADAFVFSGTPGENIS